MDTGAPGDAAHTEWFMQPNIPVFLLATDPGKPELHWQLPPSPGE